MITKITPEQEAAIPVFIQKWIDAATKPMQDGIDWVNKMYNVMSNKQPLVFIADSPFGACIMETIVRSQLRSQLGSQLGSQLYSQLSSQLSSQLDSQLGSQLYSQLSSQLDSQLDSQLGSQLYSQLDSQLRSQLRSQLGSQLDSQLRSQLSSQLDSQLRSQLGSQLYSQLSSQLDSQLDSQLSSQLSSLNNDWYLGLWWLAWCGWYEFGKYIGVKYPNDIYDLFIGYNLNIHFIIPYENIAIISQKPTIIHWKNGVLHNDGGKSVEYADDWGIWSLNGVSVPQWLAETKDTDIEPSKLLDIDNAEVRREFVRKVGLDRISYKLNAKCLNKVGDYEVLQLNIKDRNYHYLKMLNPSIEVWHVEGIPNNIKSVAEALHWRKPERLRNLPIDDIDGEDYYQQGDIVIWPKKAKSVKSKPCILT